MVCAVYFATLWGRAELTPGLLVSPSAFGLPAEESHFDVLFIVFVLALLSGPVWMRYVLESRGPASTGGRIERRIAIGCTFTYGLGTALWFAEFPGSMMTSMVLGLAPLPFTWAAIVRMRRRRTS